MATGAYSDRFTNHDEVGTPNTGDRLAVVRGDNQETILLGKMNGPPPSKPTPVDPDCEGFANPSGKFVNPTWSSDGLTLAWHENDGIWVAAIPANLMDCAGLSNPVLRIPGAKEPDFGPAAINPGARPPCGNPGNPAICPDGTCPTCDGGGGGGTGDLRKKLTALLAAEAKTLGRLGIRGLLRRKRTRIAYEADGPGTLALRLTGSPAAGASRASLLAKGGHVFAAASRAQIAMKLTRKGTRVLRRAARVRASLRATFTPAGGAPVTASRKIRLKR